MAYSGLLDFFVPQFPQLSNSNNSVIHFHVSDKFLSSSYCAVPGAGHWEYGTMNKHRTPGLHKGRTGCKQPTNKEKQDLLGSGQMACREEVMGGLALESNGGGSPLGQKE